MSPRRERPSPEPVRGSIPRDVLTPEYDHGRIPSPRTERVSPDDYRREASPDLKPEHQDSPEYGGGESPILDRYRSIVNKEKVEPASPVGSITFGSPLEHLGLTSFMAVKYCGQSNLHVVSQSCPSPGISFIHTVQGAAQVSRITYVNSVHGLAKSSCEESMESTALKDIHMPSRLMENFYIRHSTSIV